MMTMPSGMPPESRDPKILFQFLVTLLPVASGKSVAFSESPSTDCLTVFDRGYLMVEV